MLTDVPRIAPCLPGAELKDIDGDDYKGVVKVKVGPISAQYSGVARFVERDESAGRAVLSAEGRDTRGAGNARATITATLCPDGDGTEVSVVTDLDVTGRVAQFGRSVLADVSAKLMEQFADCLSEQLAAPEPQPGRESAAESGKIPLAGAVPVDMLRLAGGSVLRLVAPVAGAGAVGLLILWRNRRRRGRRRR